MGAPPSDDPLLDDTTKQLLTALDAHEASAPGEWISSLGLCALVRENTGARIHWRTADRLLARGKQLAERRKRSTRWYYRILAAGRAAAGAAPSAVTVVDPTTAVAATIEFHDLLGSLAGTVSVCDPYLDDVSLEHLSSVPAGSAIRVLTHNIRGSGKLSRIVAAFRTEGRNLEIRIARPGVLHDRYVIDDAGILILGTSLNGFGKKQSFLIRGGADLRVQMQQFFDREWLGSTPWP